MAGVRGELHIAVRGMCATPGRAPGCGGVEARVPCPAPSVIGSGRRGRRGRYERRPLRQREQGGSSYVFMAEARRAWPRSSGAKRVGAGENGASSTVSHDEPLAGGGPASPTRSRSIVDRALTGASGGHSSRRAQQFVSTRANRRIVECAAGGPDRAQRLGNARSSGAYAVRREGAGAARNSAAPMRSPRFRHTPLWLRRSGGTEIVCGVTARAGGSVGRPLPSRA